MRYLTFVLFLIFLQNSAINSFAEHTKPNVIFFNIDDLGYADTGAFGSKLNRTPHIDQLAQEGIKLKCMYAAPVCSPSRSALMTGCYPKRVGIPSVLFPEGTNGINSSEYTMAEMFKDQGYTTQCIGKWHLGDQPEFMPTRHGFDHYFGLPYSNDMGPAADGTKSNLGDPLPTAGKKVNKGQPPLPLLQDEKCLGKITGKEQVSLTEEYTTRAVEFIKLHQDKPFFLYLPHTAVHFPLYPSEKFQQKSPHGYYSDWVEEVDWSVGEVLQALDTYKLKEKTFVVFTSDNGGTNRGFNTPLRGHKASTWEGGMRVVTICRYPGKIPAGTESDELLSNMDFLPTFAHLTGAKLPADNLIDGKNIWPILSGETNAKTPHTQFYFFKGNDLEAVRTGPWKLHLKEQQLFHLLDDVGELHNVAAKHPVIVQQLLALTEQTTSDLGTNKPGPGCRPSGKVTNPLPIINHDQSIRKEFQ